MKSRRNNRGNGNENGKEFIYIPVALATLIIGTILHEIFTALIAWINGWESQTATALITGWTTATIITSDAEQTSTLAVWSFFMVPSLLIFLITTAVIIIKPEKIVLIVGVIFQFLNLASIEPGITGSDANSAVQFLISRGWTSTSAYGLHYIIFAMGALIFVISLFISIENNPKDAKTRIKNIFH